MLGRGALGRQTQKRKGSLFQGAAPPQTLGSLCLASRFSMRGQFFFWSFVCSWQNHNSLICFLIYRVSMSATQREKVILCIFRERGRAGEREGEKHGCVRETSISCLSHVPPTGDLTHNPGKCPDWKLNWRPFVSQAGVQSPEPHQPGREKAILNSQFPDWPKLG